MKPGLANRPSSPGAGHQLEYLGAEQDQSHRAIFAGHRSGSLARSVPLRATGTRSSCPIAKARPKDVLGGMHLAEISSQVAPSAHAVLMLDQAGWHMSGALEVPTNSTLLALPPKCPKLNPVENVWQVMRDNWLSNRTFSSYDNILDHCSFAWNRLINQPWRIMTLGMQTWAHRS